MIQSVFVPFRRSRLMLGCASLCPWCRRGRSTMTTATARLMAWTKRARRPAPTRDTRGIIGVYTHVCMCVVRLEKVPLDISCSWRSEWSNCRASYIVPRVSLFRVANLSPCGVQCPIRKNQHSRYTIRTSTYRSYHNSSV